MKTRIATSVVGIAILIVVMNFFNTLVFDAAIALLALIGVHEAWSAVGYTKKEWYIYAGSIPAALLVLFINQPGVMTLAMPIVGVTAVGYSLLLVARSERFSFSQLSSYLLFSMVILYSFYSFIYLKYTFPVGSYRAEAMYFIVLILCYAWGGDTFAYFAGRFFGRHKLAPVVSPKKTVEGAVGGVLGCVLLGEICTLVYLRVDEAGCAFFAHRSPASFTLIIACVGVVAALLGILGDLFASVIKRQHGIKDYGTIFPGHGGILDRFDSVMFVAVFISMMVRWMFNLIP